MLNANSSGLPRPISLLNKVHTNSKNAIKLQLYDMVKISFAKIILKADITLFSSREYQSMQLSNFKNKLTKIKTAL